LTFGWNDYSDELLMADGEQLMVEINTLTFILSLEGEERKKTGLHS